MLHYSPEAERDAAVPVFSGSNSGSELRACTTGLCMRLLSQGCHLATSRAVVCHPGLEEDSDFSEPGR